MIAMPATAAAQVGADTAAALLTFPYVVVDSATGRDTRIQIGNNGDTAVDVRCFYQRVVGECINGGPEESCFPEARTCSGFCIDHFEVVEWSLRLQPREPLSWIAGGGDALRGIESIADPSIGPLRCLAVVAPGTTSPNTLVGVANVERVTETEFDVAAYSAFGFRAIDDRPDGDDTLVLGGSAGEYRGCPDSVVLQNFYDAAQLTGEAIDDAEVTTVLVTTPCGGDLFDGSVESDQVLQYLTINELAQRFSTSRPLGYDVRPLSRTETLTTPERSIFHFAVASTLTGQTYLHPAHADRGGVIALAIQRHRLLDGSDRVTTAIYGAQLEGEREQPETLVLSGVFPTAVPSTLPATPTVPAPTPTSETTLPATVTATAAPDTPVAAPTATAGAETPGATATAANTPPGTGQPTPTPTGPLPATATSSATATVHSLESGTGSAGGGCQAGSGDAAALPLLSLVVLALSRLGRRLALVAAVILPLAAAPPARAQLTTERGASILSFPRVIVAETTDTIVQIATLEGLDELTRARCTYVAAGTSEQVDFEIVFKWRQPAHWLASTGKSDDVDFGVVPPLPSEFMGELVCIELSAGEGLPVSRNSLRGSATVVDRDEGVIRYSALGSRGFPTNDHDGFLCLGGSPRAGCPDGAEYEACPRSWYLSHPMDGSRDERLPEDSSVETILTVVPCSRDFALQIPGQVALSFTLTDEMEQQFSATTEVVGWQSFALADVAAEFAAAGVSRYALTTIRTAEGSGGFALTAHVVRRAGGAASSTSATAIEVPRDGRDVADEIVLTVETVP
jgi:hypothetical protein